MCYGNTKDVPYDIPKYLDAVHNTLEAFEYLEDDSEPEDNWEEGSDWSFTHEDIPDMSVYWDPEPLLKDILKKNFCR